MKMHNLKKRTAICFTLLLILLIAMAIVVDAVFGNSFFNFVVIFEYVSLCGLMIIYLYRLLDDKEETKSIVRKKVRIFMLINNIIAVLWTYYILALAPSIMRKAIAETGTIEGIIMIVMSLSFGAVVAVTNAAIYLVMVKGYSIPVVANISNENLIRDRFDKKYKDKTPEKVIAGYVRILMVIYIIVIVVALNVGALYAGTGSPLYKLMTDDFDAGFNVCSITLVFIVVSLASIVCGILVKILNVLSETMGQRTETICRMLGGLIKVIIAVYTVFTCMQIVGIDTGALFASAGVASVIIGLGSQELIKDTIAGLFIIFEGEYRVGDYVTVDNFRGEVIEIGVRTTKIREDTDNIMIINNSEIRKVVNMTRMSSYICCDVSVGYDVKLEEVEDKIKPNLHIIEDNLPELTGPVTYADVMRLADSSVVIRIQSRCRENDKTVLQRRFNREVLLLFENQGIEIPYSQVVVHNER